MRVAVIGRSEILYETALRLVAAGQDIGVIVTAKKAPEYKVGTAEFAGLAKRLGARFLRTSKIAESEAELRAMGPIDVGVSVNYPGLIPQHIIDIFPLGILNAHGGDLPRYRGNACQAWAIINGEERVGLCVHKMVGGELDTGDLMARAYRPIDRTTRVTDLWNWMRDLTPSLFEEALARLAADPSWVLERQSTDPADALRCYPRRPEDGRIDWNRTALEILRLVNASNDPYSGAYCELEGKRLTVWDAQLVGEGERFLAVPGQVTAVHDRWVQVATGAGKIQLNLVERDGERAPPSQFVTSSRTRLT